MNAYNPGQKRSLEMWWRSFDERAFTVDAFEWEEGAAVPRFVRWTNNGRACVVKGAGANFGGWAIIAVIGFPTGFHLSDGNGVYHVDKRGHWHCFANAITGQVVATRYFKSMFAAVFHTRDAADGPFVFVPKRTRNQRPPAPARREFPGKVFSDLVFETLAAGAP